MNWKWIEIEYIKYTYILHDQKKLFFDVEQNITSTDKSNSHNREYTGDPNLRAKITKNHYCGA